MVFSSLVFICVFFPCVFLLNLILPSLALRNAVLLVASLLFYAYGEPVYLILLLISSFLNYLFALFVRKGEKKNGLALAIAVITNLGILGFFKYAEMAVELFDAVTGMAVPVPQIPLPIGISFFTFQAMSYVIDVYRGDADSTKNYGKVLLYISFFPQLIAGPIIKYRDIEKQISNRKVTVERTAYGMKRFIYGLSKKVLIANTVGLVADHIFSASSGEINVVTAWIGALAYLLQIYYDFSGYSDMAIGMGSMFGFHILENFRHPYCAASIKDFWRRWHISLSTWFKEYLYIPLGGNRKGKLRTSVNKLIVFFCTGLWHGASLTFVAWGLYHGAFQFLEDFGRNRNIRFPKWIGHIYLIVVVTIGFVLFRSDSFGQATLMIGQMFTGFHFEAEAMCLAAENLSANVIAAFFFGSLFAFPVSDAVADWSEKSLPKGFSDFVMYVVTLLLLILCMLQLAGRSYNPFIYFRF